LEVQSIGEGEDVYVLCDKRNCVTMI